MGIRKISKRKTYYVVEKALLLGKYKTSGAKKHNGAQKMSLAWVHLNAGLNKKKTNSVTA